MKKIFIFILFFIILSSALYSTDIYELIDNYDWSAIDKHAETAPRSASSSVKKLTSFLIKEEYSDLEKVRSIYVWVCSNISYDTASFFSGSYSSSAPGSVLTSRKSVCQGYAELFTSLAEEAGLESIVISGFSKGYGFTVGDTLGSVPNHAWNAVKIDSKWLLLDSTWGAGYVSGRNFIRRFNDHYFITPAEEFIYDHFPADFRWQLLAESITEGSYSNLVYLRPHFFQAGLRVKSHKQAAVQTGSSQRIVLSGPDGLSLIAEIDRGGSKLPGKYAFVQRINDDYVIDTVFPRAGTYRLRIFVKNSKNPGNYKWACDYSITADSGADKNAGFPVTYQRFAEAVLEEPLTGSLKQGELCFVNIFIPEAESAAVITDVKWIYLKNLDQWFS